MATPKMKFALQVDPRRFIDFKMRRNPPKEIVAFMEGFMEHLARKMVREIRKAVHQQKYKNSWQQLSDSWKTRKKKLRLDPRMWKASGELLDSINWWRSRTDDCWYVGVHPRKRHSVYKFGGIYKTKKQKALLIDIIRWMENGTRKMPPRPLFGPVLEEVRKAVPKLYQEYISTVKGRDKLEKAMNAPGAVPNVITSKRGFPPKKRAAKRATKKPRPPAKKQPAKKAPKTAKKKAPVKKAPVKKQGVKKASKKTVKKKAGKK